MALFIFMCPSCFNSLQHQKSLDSKLNCIKHFGSIPTIDTSKDIAGSNFAIIDFNFVFEKMDTLYCILQNPSPKTIALNPYFGPYPAASFP